uniref:Sperm surface protein Sp17 n=1 Tax=Chelydra serpentina TaxID=8475 RepID=A0A8C3RW00_CHESE
MSIPFSNTHHRIPPGFANLLEGLAREVLRKQPEDIPAFAANYFEELLDKREKTMFDPAEWGAKLDDRFYNNKAFEVGWDCCSEGVSLQLCTSLFMEVELVLKLRNGTRGITDSHRWGEAEFPFGILVLEQSPKRLRLELFPIVK